MLEFCSSFKNNFQNNCYHKKKQPAKILSASQNDVCSFHVLLGILTCLTGHNTVKIIQILVFIGNTPIFPGPNSLALRQTLICIVKKQLFDCTIFAFHNIRI